MPDSFDAARTALAAAEAAYDAAIANDATDDATIAAIQAQLTTAQNALTAAQADDAQDTATIAALEAEVENLRDQLNNQNPDTTPPTVPGKPTGSSPNTTSIALQWAGSADVASPPVTYLVYRDAVTTPVATVTNTSATITGLTPGSVHTFQVAARDAVGNTSPKSTASNQITVDSNVPGGKINLPLVVGISGSSNLDGLGDRTFGNSGKLAPPTRRTKAACPRVHHSEKLAIGTTVTRAMVKAWVANGIAGDLWEIWHESDVDRRSGGSLSQLNDKLRMKNEMHAHLVSLRNAGEIPMMYSVNTVSSYSLSTPTLLATMPDYDADADFFGADLDGGDFPKDYSDTTLLDRCQQWADDHHNGNLTFPEWGWNNDTAGNRMSVMKTQSAKIITWEPAMLVFHDNPNFGATLTSAERTEWSRVAKGYMAAA